MPQPVRDSAPAVPIVSLAEIKTHCRIDIEDTEDDALLRSLVAAATRHLDGWSGMLGRCLITQTWRLDFAGWPASGTLRLPFPDVDWAAVTYRDANDAEQTVSDTLHELFEDAVGTCLRFKSAFTSPTLYSDRAFPVSVLFDAGYGPKASDVPEDIRTAAKMMAGHWYENREAVAAAPTSVVPMAVDALLDPHKRKRI